ncbi:hypothetical protein HY948_03745 [Candidatus Gottesmanbacteria bacterium]|nr:hypothetical protein [Candidatus Gottesmanbacteria bacterium]
MADPERVLTNQELFPPADPLTLDQAGAGSAGGGSVEVAKDDDGIPFNQGMQGE